MCSSEDGRILVRKAIYKRLLGQVCQVTALCSFARLLTDRERNGSPCEQENTGGSESPEWVAGAHGHSHRSRHLGGFGVSGWLLFISHSWGSLLAGQEILLTWILVNRETVVRYNYTVKQTLQLKRNEQTKSIQIIYTVVTKESTKDNTGLYLN